MELYLSTFERDSLGLENLQIPVDTTFNFSQTLESNDAFFYVEDDIKINDQFKVNLGIHLDFLIQIINHIILFNLDFHLDF